KIQQKVNELSGTETQELPSKIEIQAKGYTDYVDEIIRDNLNLDRELTEDVFMNSDGITGQTNPEKYARLNDEGLVIQGGAIKIIRPDGAVWMQDGLTQQDYAVSGFDPHLMDVGRSPGTTTYKAFFDTASFWDTRR